MFELLKMIHFLSFSIAIGAGISSLVLAARLAGFPPQAMPQLGGFRLILGRLSTIGLLLLWLTGIAMIAATGGLKVFDNQVFLWKLGAVSVLTLFSITANVMVAKAKKAAKPPDARLMKRLGYWSQAMAILALTLAVVAFS